MRDEKPNSSLTSPLLGRPGSSDPNSPFYDDPLFGHPWMTAEQSEAKRRKRHALWRSWLSDDDWRQIAALAEQVDPLFTPARIEGLGGGRLAVGVRLTGSAGGHSGERIGTLRAGKVEVIVWS